MKRWDNQVILNHPTAVGLATNKLLTFEKFKVAGVKHPEWTTDSGDAFSWVEEDIPTVIRSTLTGKGGEGIEIAKDFDDYIDEYGDAHFPIAPLYTKYFKKKYEFRVHVFN